MKSKLRQYLQNTFRNQKIMDQTRIVTILLTVKLQIFVIYDGDRYDDACVQ